MGAMRRLLRLSHPIWLLVSTGIALWLFSASEPPPGGSRGSLPYPEPRQVTGPPLETAIALMGQDPAEVVESEGAESR
jgi:hypothetical protein